MRDISLLQLALGLVPPWTVASSDFDAAARWLDIHIDFAMGSRFDCPACGADNCPVHDTEQTSWRHLNSFQNTRPTCMPVCHACAAPSVGSRRSAYRGRARAAASPCCSRR